MIVTSNFAMSGRDARAVAISQGVPWWYKGARILELAPPRWLLNETKETGDTKKFDDVFREQIANLKPDDVVKMLPPDAILLCWESFNVRCHRRMVAEWIEEKLGIEVPEMGKDRAESLPYIQQVGKLAKAKRGSRSQILMF